MARKQKVVINDINEYLKSAKRHIGEPVEYFFKYKDPKKSAAALEQALKSQKNLGTADKRFLQSAIKEQKRARGLGGKIKEAFVGKPAEVGEQPLYTPEQEDFLKRMLQVGAPAYEQALQQLQQLQPSPLESQISGLMQQLAPQLTQQAMGSEMPQVLFPSQLAQQAQPDILNMLSAAFAPSVQQAIPYYSQQFGEYLQSDKPQQQLETLLSQLGSGARGVGNYASTLAAPIFSRLQGLLGYGQQ